MKTKTVVLICILAPIFIFLDCFIFYIIKPDWALLAFSYTNLAWFLVLGFWLLPKIRIQNKEAV